MNYSFWKVAAIWNLEFLIWNFPPYIASGMKDRKTTTLWQRIWKITKRTFLILFIAQFVYIILLKWMDPPVTITQLQNWISGDGLKRDYVDYDDMSYNIKLAVISSEDQLFPDHSGFDWKSIEKAWNYNK